MALISGIVTGANLGIVGDSIGLYRVSWSSASSLSRTVYVRYRVFGDVSWIDAGTISVPPNGVPSPRPFIVISAPVKGTRYEVNLTSSLVDEDFTTLITMPLVLMGGYYLVADSLYNICGSDPIFLFSDAPFAVGVKMYTDSALTSLADYDYISRKTYGDIYSMAAGEVGASIGLGCFNSISGLFVKSNSLSLCDGVYEELFSDALVITDLIGYKIYTDLELTTPLTGYDYVMSGVDGTIYSINNATGEVLSVADTCDDYFNVIVSNTNAQRSIDLIEFDDVIIEGPIAPGDTFYGVHKAFEGIISVKISGGGSCETCGSGTLDLLVNATPVESLTVQDGVYFFESAVYAGDDEITIELKNTVAAP